MAGNYTDFSAYQSYYDRISNVLKQIQMGSGAADQYSGSRTSSAQTVSGRSFADTFQYFKNKDSGLDVPESMDAVFEEAAQIYNVPVNLLKAIGKAESGFDASAVSSAGAIGVMQLMPATAASLGVSDPYDARSNIMGGAKYISEKLTQYGGNIELALAAYNAGSGNVAKYGGVPPFKETQNYIKKVKEYMGTDITTGVTLPGTGESSGTGVVSLLEKLQDTYTYTQKDAQYYVQMLRMQMQSGSSMLGGTGSDDEKGGFYL